MGEACAGDPPIPAQASLVFLDPSLADTYRYSNTVAGFITGSSRSGIGAQKVATS